MPDGEFEINLFTQYDLFEPVPDSVDVVSNTILKDLYNH